MLLRKIRQESDIDGDVFNESHVGGFLPAFTKMAAAATSDMPASAPVGRLLDRLNLGSSLDSSSLNSSSSSSGSSYYIAASRSASMLAINGSRPGSAIRHSLSERRMTSAVVPTLSLADSFDQVKGANQYKICLYLIYNILRRF
jgi:hypothetical protein